MQASDAERLRVALALAIAASPGLNDVWIRDGALLDDDSLELVAKHAIAAGKRIWIERVGTKDPGVIVIKDGQVIHQRGPNTGSFWNGTLSAGATGALSLAGSAGLAKSFSVKMTGLPFASATAAPMNGSMNT